MGYSLSDDDQLIERTVAELASNFGIDAASDCDRHDRFPPLFAQCMDLGLGALAMPQEQGGAGATGFALAIYELAQVCPNTAITVANQCAIAGQLCELGEPAQALAAEAATGHQVAWLATEEAGGSDKRQMGTFAAPVENGWSITGQKVWSMSASKAASLLVVASTPDGSGLFRISADASGVSLGQNEALLGLRAAGIRTVYLSGVNVEADAQLASWPQAAQTPRLNEWLQLGAAAAILGCIAGAQKAANAFAETRVQFGNPIGRYQAVSDAVVNIDVKLAAGRALLLEAAARVGESDGPLFVARAKEYAQEESVRLTRQAIRIQGGTGFMREGGTERFARDARALQFVGEPFAVQRRTIRESLLDIDFSQPAR